MSEAPRRSCILVELVDGSLRAFDFPDEDSAERWYAECRGEWNAGRNLVFYLRMHYGADNAILDGDDVAHLEVTTRADAERRGAECVNAVLFG